VKTFVGNIVVAAGLLAAAGVAHAADGDTLKKVQERGALRCSGADGSFLGFMELDDKGNWKGLDIDLCRALAAGIFGTSKGHLEIVPISWAQRWPALQSGDIDVVIKSSDWNLSRDRDLHLAMSLPYLMGSYRMLTHASTGATDIKGLNGATICVSAGSAAQTSLTRVLEGASVKAEVVAYEKTDEERNAYLDGRCDAMLEGLEVLAGIRTQAKNPQDHVLLPNVFAVVPLSIIVPEGDPQWLDIQNWMLSSLWYAEANGITSENIDKIRANPPSTTTAKFLGVTPGYGASLGLPDDWAYNIIKEVGNYKEIYDTTQGDLSPYKIPRGVNELFSNGGVHYPLSLD
jgi:general L-amino acid transport system substrate-binding protein